MTNPRDNQWEAERDKVDFFATTFLRVSKEDRLLRALLSRLRDSTPEFVPDSVQVSWLDESYGERSESTKPLTDAMVSRVHGELETRKHAVATLTRGAPPIALIRLASGADSGRPYDSVTFEARRELAASSRGRRKLLRFAQILFETYACFFGDLGTVHLYDMGPADRTGARRVISPPPEYVALVGANRFLDAPCEVVEKFGDGCFLLLLAEDFQVLEMDESLLEERRSRLVQHFGPEYFSYVDENRPKIVLPQFAANGARTGHRRIR